MISAIRLVVYHASVSFGAWNLVIEGEWSDKKRRALLFYLFRIELTIHRETQEYECPAIMVDV